eukprot:CAMPEP_0117037880 /NCGR_PEP_ID=MMETSP0472-20121206/26695_1 /TAXON_ID=693140 ORGANISM="Tiarina fusus, Strain LIS" /NCGR_SAMPLE_ID=MMETSP0472 /ASSEMBLY_ACC=CAM_ASM_000603 /LENGTH=302 /DNA_ID=CAMNT_0004747961 /DNA_START=188 /DNA_END=1096 /DNA_ORIENTATION=+
MKLSRSTVYAACFFSGSLSPATAFLPVHAPRHHPRSTAITFSSPSSSSTTPTTTTTTTSLSYEQDGGNANETPVFTSPVLQQVYLSLLQHKQEYGNPNIPLGSKEGRQCHTLRRLHIQNKLTVDEVEWLTTIGFTFHSLEDVYKYADFDTLLTRLLEYETAHPDNNFQVPKKCPEDPELGAWVTGIRRLGPDGVNPVHERRLNEVGFAWKSTRKCGSKFMSQYRTYLEILKEKEENGDGDINDNNENERSNAETLIAADPKAVGWVQAQQEVLKRGDLSQTRVHYMEQLFGEDWTMIGKTIQ